MKKRYYLSVFIVVAVAAALFYYEKNVPEPRDIVGTEIHPATEVGLEKSNIEVIDKPSVIDKVVEKTGNLTISAFQKISKPELIHDVTFMSQAPTANWDHPFDEACEEASMLMALDFLAKIDLSKDSGLSLESRIYDLYDWEAHNSYDIDINISEVKSVLKDRFEVDSKIILNPTVQKIIDELDNNSVIIVPALGRELKNPYFQNPGPLYHMLVVIGYDQDRREFITNDPGTRRGKNFRYSMDHLVSVIRDWNGGDVANGQSIVLVVSK